MRARSSDAPDRPNQDHQGWSPADRGPAGAVTPPAARLTLADPAELLSQTRVAALLHARDDAARELIAQGELTTVDGKVPRWVLLEWQQARIERERRRMSR